MMRAINSVKTHERFDGAFFVTLGLLVLIRIMALEETLIALRLPATTENVNLTLYQGTIIPFNGVNLTLPHTVVVPATYQSSFIELNPVAQFNILFFAATMFGAALFLSLTTLRIKNKQARMVFYAGLIGLVLADALTDFMGFLRYVWNFPLIYTMVVPWMVLAFLPVFAAVWQLEGKPSPPKGSLEA